MFNFFITMNSDTIVKLIISKYHSPRCAMLNECNTQGCFAFQIRLRLNDVIVNCHAISLLRYFAQWFPNVVFLLNSKRYFLAWGHSFCLVLEVMTYLIFGWRTWQRIIKVYQHTEIQNVIIPNFPYHSYIVLIVNGIF